MEMKPKFSQKNLIMFAEFSIIFQVNYHGNP